MLQDDASTELTDAALGIAPTAPALEIANAIARLHKEFVGRGPTNSRTTIDGELVVVLLEGGFTRAERTLDDSERRDLVLAGRVGLQDAMRTAMIDVVERALGRRVRSFMSANDLERNLQSEIFVLEGPSTPDVVDDPPVSR
ncbi:MAG TPA: Na-translocating system protein MpsC family protein [Solirubrobacteraceae bacterium]|nr:Na-translocating system protein MpsC family protein [Solirubrobacteraceae bacterium]